ncbi:hypothetical protein [Alicyclobacillus sp. SO9]|uniref:hypothetical protein n=1 Tax=Alicyclobacillus sp. SO9 TaxID=2665646 RepID=UPI0018E6ED85|nr:hypothetical protein [Alicyclobacillus sp. SO9]
MISRRMIQTFVGLFWLFNIPFLGAGTSFVHVSSGIVETMIGLALIFNFKPKWTLLLSTCWSLLLWLLLLQKGTGQILSGQVLPLYGQAGTALLFCIISVAIWPAKKGGPSIWNERGVRLAQISLGVLFAAGFVLHFQVTYLMQQGLSQFSRIPWLQWFASYQGSGLSMIFAVSEMTIAVMFIGGFSLRWALWVSVVLDGVFWIAQLYGEIVDPLAVSTTSGLLLLAVLVSAGPKQWGRHNISANTGRPVLR